MRRPQPASTSPCRFPQAASSGTPSQIRLPVASAPRREQQEQHREQREGEGALPTRRPREALHEDDQRDEQRGAVGRVAPEPGASAPNPTAAATAWRPAGPEPRRGRGTEPRRPAPRPPGRRADPDGAAGERDRAGQDDRARPRARAARATAHRLRSGRSRRTQARDRRYELTPPAGRRGSQCELPCKRIRVASPDDLRAASAPGTGERAQTDVFESRRTRFVLSTAKTSRGNLPGAKRGKRWRERRRGLAEGHAGSAGGGARGGRGPAVLALLGPGAAAAGVGAPMTRTSLEKETLLEINATRAAHGLAPLAFSRRRSSPPRRPPTRSRWPRRAPPPRRGRRR